MKTWQNTDEGGPEEITIGIAAIFDGHGGQEASEMASRKLSDYFLVHVVFTAYKRALRGNKENHVPQTVKRFGHWYWRKSRLLLFFVVQKPFYVLNISVWERVDVDDSQIGKIWSSFLKYLDLSQFKYQPLILHLMNKIWTLYYYTSLPHICVSSWILCYIFVF